MVIPKSSPARILAAAFLPLFAAALFAQDQQKVKIVSWVRIATEKVIYQGSGGNKTDCRGTINDFGSLASYSAHCTTRPNDNSVSKPVHDVYAVAEGGGRRYLLHCREVWRWSKCGSVLPGETYVFETKGRSASVQELRAEGKKVVTQKFDLVQVELMETPQ